MRKIILIICILLLIAVNAYCYEVYVEDGNVFVKKDNNITQLTSESKDTEAALHPNGEWVYFVRAFEGEFKGEVFYPKVGKEPEDGILKHELWRIDVDGKNAKKLYEHTDAAIDHPSGYAYASIDNIQFSPKGDKVYFETAKWVTSNALNVMNPDGSNIKELGAGNATKIILSTMDKDTDYSGHIVTNQHRYGLFGGSYDWYWLYDPQWNEIGVLGPDIRYFTGTWDIKYTDHSEKENIKDEYADRIEFSETEEQDNALDALKEANNKFTYKGKPIHPGLVKEFSSWISDSGIPTTVSVDVSAPHRNEYFEDDMKINDNGYVFLQEEGEPEYFYYKWLGRLNNGLHVLETGEGGGGSGIFKDMYFVEFSIGKGIREEGKPYNRLLMTVIRTHVLGDRDDGEITLFSDQNKVILGTSKYRETPVTLSFD